MEPAAIKLDQAAAQDEAFFLGGGGEAGLGQHGAEQGIFQRQFSDTGAGRPILAVFGLNAWEGWEILGGNCGEAMPGGAALDQEIVLLEFQLHVRAFGHADDVE